MDQDKYTLTWHTYPDLLKGMMMEILTSEDFADVTLVSDDRKIIKAHKNILSACSPVFKSIMQLETQNNHPAEIKLHMYLGEAKFYETSLKSLRLRKLLD